MKKNLESSACMHGWVGRSEEEGGEAEEEEEDSDETTPGWWVGGNTWRSFE